MRVMDRNRLGARRALSKYKIIDAMCKRQYDPERLANELGITRSAVSKFLNGKTHSPQIIKKMREIGVPERLLFDPYEKEAA